MGFFRFKEAVENLTNGERILIIDDERLRRLVREWARTPGQKHHPARAWYCAVVITEPN